MQDLSETKTKERALDFVLGHLRDVTGLNAASLTARTAFAEIGLESLAVINFHMRIEPFFPGLSKAFLFDCRSADDVCAYLFQHWPDAARALAESLQSRAALTSTQQSDEAQEEWPDIALLRPTSDTKLRETGRSSEGAFAIVGMHCRFPGAESPAAFWENLLSGRDSIGEIPKGRWSINDFFEPEPGEARKKGRSYSKWGGFLDDVDRFDAPFFGISPREAAMMDPQERLFMECAWHALEDAALLGERSAPLDRDGGLDVGVFLGVTTNTYSLLGPSLWRAGMTEIPTAMPWSGANRLSYALNLRGPSMAVDTACSSALIALNLACESLARGECRAAVAGGVNLYLHPAKYVQLCQQHMLSPTGRCHAFGQDADGFAPGEGVGAVVLKRLADAHHDNDRILAVVLGSAVNHGGHTNGYTVPSPGAQSRVIKQALTRAGVDGTTIGYIEAHGTGTKLGDPIEIDGLKQAFGAEPSAPDCAVGSVKSNIGHLEAAAGVASLIKVVQQLRHRRIAPSLHAQHLNPALGLDGSRFFIAREAADWRPCGLTDRLRAGLSSFGAGGANAHVIVEDAPQPRACGEASGPLVFPLSARSAEQLRDAAAQLRDFIAADEPAAFARLAFTLQCGRRHFDHRFAVAAANHRELVAHLTAFLTGAAAADTRERDDTSSQALASRWAAGENVNWLSRWTNPPRPLDAPLYPFARDRHWVSPLDVESALDRFSIAFTGDELFLRDHRINGEPVLPAAAYLGFCLETARRSGLEGAFELRNLTWAAPFRPRDGVKSIICAATREPDGLSLDMSSRPATGDGQIVVHFKGRCAVPATASPEAPAESLSSLRARFTEEADAKGCYARFDALGLEYGPSFRCMEAAWLGENEALIELRRRAEDQPTALDPAMLDGVLQSAFLCSRAVRQHDDVAFVPYGAQSIRVHGTLGEHAYVHARRRQGQASDSQAFDFTVFATTGEVLLEIIDFAFRRFTATPRAAAEADALHLLAPAWIAEPLQDKAVATGNLLIFDRDAALYESLRALSAGEGPPTDPWLALDSDKFLVRDGRIIEWNPRS
ncbi:MAG: beta-ketoacyl synthase N-terminal-like domain-containing protein, partial [Beijerinckiaceae bacterium]|nr:beta-ketoacyl synthase N-terminal-like domain-containing protein [Beijerinckiaceae bacterium]